jgi:hypothetical protein
MQGFLVGRPCNFKTIMFGQKVSMIFNNICDVLQKINSI